MDLGDWMNKVLVGWGVNPSVANLIDESIIAVLMLGVAVGLNYLCQAIFTGGVGHYVKARSNAWIQLLIKRKVFRYLIHAIPSVIIYMMLPAAFVRGKELLVFSQKLCLLYIIYSILLAINGLLLMMLDVYNNKEESKSHPLKGLIQILQVFLFFIGAIVMISLVVNKSPASLLAGLGASAAILMLVFKDTILGFVAGVQLSANDMVRLGDWITVPASNADGIVQEVTINTVKVQNFDNTISTIPPYTLVTTSFQNWRGMSESGGRRVKKSIYLDITTLKLCTSDMLDTIRKNVPLLSDYQPEKDVVPTNSQVYRVYIERYLCSLPTVNQDLDLIIRQLQSTEYGVPIQIYFFSKDKVWKDYERIQSDIFDHLLVMVDQFELKVYQYS